MQRSRRRLRITSLVVVLLASLASCGDDDDEPAADDATTTTAPPATLPAEEATLLLDEQGLLVAATELPFGTGRAVVLDAVADVLGAPTKEGRQDECPAGEQDFARFGDGADHLALDFADDALVGWSVDHESELQTEEGLGIGSTVADLEAIYGPVDLDTESTLGIEFYVADNLSGLVSEDSPAGEITALWAGSVCIFR